MSNRLLYQISTLTNARNQHSSLEAVLAIVFPKFFLAATSQPQIRDQHILFIFSTKYYQQKVTKNRYVNATSWSVHVGSSFWSPLLTFSNWFDLSCSTTSKLVFDLFFFFKCKFSILSYRFYTFLGCFSPFSEYFCWIFVLYLLFGKSIIQTQFTWS